MRTAQFSLTGSTKQQRPQLGKSPVGCASEAPGCLGLQWPPRLHCPPASPLHHLPKSPLHRPPESPLHRPPARPPAPPSTAYPCTAPPAQQPSSGEAPRCHGHLRAVKSAAGKMRCSSPSLPQLLSVLSSCFHGRVLGSLP